MLKPVMFATLSLVVLTFLSVRLVSGDSVNRDIKLYKDCPEFIEVRSDPTKRGLIAFVIKIQPEEATNAGGHVRTVGHLEISSENSHVLATMQIHRSSIGDSDEFRFELAPQLAKHSVFTITASPIEEDGTPTAGDSQTSRIHLSGFLPKPISDTKSRQRPNLP